MRFRPTAHLLLMGLLVAGVLWIGAVSERTAISERTETSSVDGAGKTPGNRSRQVGPDLRLSWNDSSSEGRSVSPTVLRVGASRRFVVRIDNVGETSTTEVLITAYTPLGPYGRPSTVPALVPGSRRLHAIDLVAATGMRELCAVAELLDPLRTHPADSNAEDNRLCRTLHLSRPIQTTNDSKGDRP